MSPDDTEAIQAAENKASKRDIDELYDAAPEDDASGMNLDLAAATATDPAMLSYMRSLNQARQDIDELYDAAPEDDVTPETMKAKRHKTKCSDDEELDSTGLVFAAPLLPAPYFYYRDHSTELDDDPLTPITKAGHSPCFPVKMHAVLSSHKLAHIVAWDVHGRSFRIIRPKQFQLEVLPYFFDHSNLSSFVKQANGWGFRRFTTGPNCNSYYHEYFLRGMPWLCKKMRRLKVGEKKHVMAEHEPDLCIIARECPLRNFPISKEIQVVWKILQSGPRTPMPVPRAVDPLNPIHSAATTFGAAVPVDALATEENNNKPAVSSQTLASANQTSNASIDLALTALRMRAASGMNLDLAAATATDPAMLSYMRSLNQARQDIGFIRGFRAAMQYQNSINNGIFGIDTLPLSPAAMDMIPHSLLSDEWLINSQVRSQLFAKDNVDQMEALSAVRRGLSGSLTLEQLQAYQAGLWRP